jgi:glycosidase
MSYVGAPMVYYGDEAGAWGGGDPDDRMPMIWRELTYEPQTIDPRGRERQPDEVKFDEDLFAFYKKAIALRRESDALNHGEFTVVATDDLGRTLVIGRRSTKQTLLVALNRGDQESHIDLHVSPTKLTPVFVTQGELDQVRVAPSTNGMALTLPPLTGAVLRYE